MIPHRTLPIPAQRNHVSKTPKKEEHPQYTDPEQTCVSRTLIIEKAILGADVNVADLGPQYVKALRMQSIVRWK
jgi:hypothetical protein